VLQQAVRSATPSVLEFMLGLPQHQWTDFDVRTALLLSVKLDRSETLRVFLRHPTASGAVKKLGGLAMEVAREFGNKRSEEVLVEHYNFTKPPGGRRIGETEADGAGAGEQSHQQPLSPLAQAIRDNNLVELKRLVEQQQQRPRPLKLTISSFGSTIPALNFALQERRLEVALYLLSDGVYQKHSARSSSFRPAIHEAAAGGMVQVVARLIELGVDPNMLDVHGVTPLFTAVSAEQWEVVAMLLREPKLDLRAARTNGADVIFRAIRRAPMEVIRAFLARGSDPNARNRMNYTPLMSAIRHWRNDVALLLLDMPEVDVDVLNDIGESALTLSTTLPDSDVLRRLLQRTRRHINLIGHRGFSPLLSSISRNNLHTFQALIECDELDVNLCSSTYPNSSPLMFAAGDQRVDMVRMLLERGADQGIVNKKLQSALSAAVVKGSIEVTRMLLLDDVANRLSSASFVGALFNSVSSNNVSVLRLFFELTPHLIQPNMQRYHGQTLLMRALTQEAVDVVEYLLTLPGINPLWYYLSDGVRRDPLELALLSGNERIVSAFLRRLNNNTEFFRLRDLYRVMRRRADMSPTTLSMIDAHLAKLASGLKFEWSSESVAAGIEDDERGQHGSEHDVADSDINEQPEQQLRHDERTG
jgi:ankyrin repeat protein